MIDQQKKELRQKIKVLKEKQDPQDYFQQSAGLMLKLERNPMFQKAGTVMAYWSIPGEVYTHDFILKWSRKKTIILPSVDGDRMVLKVFTGYGHLVPGELYGIPEPDGPVFIDYDRIGLILVPGVAFDIKNNRMGRGKAYYDRFLKSSDAIKIGLCFGFQLFDAIPADENDIRMDAVLTL